MKKIYTWHDAKINESQYLQYFYKREKNDINGNSRYRVFILDPNMKVYETILKCYEYEIEYYVINFYKNK